MGGHCSGVCNDQESKIFYEHFTKTECQGYGFTVQIIQKLKGDGRVSNSGVVPKTSVSAGVPKKRLGIWHMQLKGRNVRLTRWWNLDLFILMT